MKVAKEVKLRGRRINTWEDTRNFMFNGKLRAIELMYAALKVHPYMTDEGYELWSRAKSYIVHGDPNHGSRTGNYI